MSRSHCLASLGTVALLALPLASASAASADDCRFQMGPYTSQSAADVAVQQAKSIGYNTSGVWGEGGIVSQLSNRRYFFNVLFAC